MASASGAARDSSTWVAMKSRRRRRRRTPSESPLAWALGMASVAAAKASGEESSGESS